jgi:hypothetical protein
MGHQKREYENFVNSGDKTNSKTLDSRHWCGHKWQHNIWNNLKSVSRYNNKSKDYLTDEQRSYADKEPLELGADLQFGPLGHA